MPAVIAKFDSRVAKFFVSASFILATIGNQVATVYQLFFILIIVGHRGSARWKASIYLFLADSQPDG